MFSRTVLKLVSVFGFEVFLDQLSGDSIKPATSQSNLLNLIFIWRKNQVLEFSGVGLTDEVNLYGQRFTVEAMYSAYINAWKVGVPSCINHDHRKLLGWCMFSGLYINPQKTYLMNSIEVGETEKERSALQARYERFLYETRILPQQSKYDELKRKLGNLLTNQAKPCWVNGVSFIDEGIVCRVLPEIKNLLSRELISLDELNYIQPGVYEKSGWLLFAHNHFRRGFSYFNTMNEPFLKELQECDSHLSPRIAIDMNCIGLLGTQVSEIEYAYWWGPKFNDNLSRIPSGVTVYENEHYDGLLSDILRTEFGWYIQDGNQTFECEEVVDIANIKEVNNEKYGCRFVHSIINPTTNLPSHLDGAIRTYTTEEMLLRLETDIKRSGRHTEYTKLWRIDGDISISLWKSLISNYFRDNTQVGEYFEGEDAKLDLRYTKQDKTISSLPRLSVKSLIPVELSSGDGLRISVKCNPIVKIPRGFDVLIKPSQSIIVNTRRKEFVENETISVVKSLRQTGLSVSLPSCSRIATGDMVNNLPLFICRDSSIANDVNNCFEKFCRIWAKKNDDRLLSYSILVNYEKMSILYSFAGHVNDFMDYYETRKTHIPQYCNDVSRWLEDSSDYLKTYSGGGKVSDDLKLRSNNGILAFPRVIIDSNQIDRIERDNNGLLVRLKLEQEENELIQKKGIGVSILHEVIESKCSACGLPYETCSCIKFLESNVFEVHDKKGFHCALWTTRPASHTKCVT